jgi:cold shock CspA family protein
MTISEQPNIFEPNVITVFFNTKLEQTKIGEIKQETENSFIAIREIDRKRIHTVNKGKALEFIINQKQTKGINQINLF